MRAAIRAARRRRAQDAAARDAAGRALAAHVLAVTADLPPVCRVAAYAATRTEPPTEALRAALRAAGHEVLLPVIAGDRVLHWAVDDGTAGAVGQPEGRPASLGVNALATCDLVLTPGLAVDHTGLRLGQGGGFYDAALAWVRPGVLVLTVLFDEELLDEPVPAEPHDRRVGGVLTPSRGVLILPTVNPWAPGATPRPSPR